MFPIKAPQHKKIKFSVSRQAAKRLRRRGLSLLLSFLLVLSVAYPMFGLFVRETRADPIVYDGNTLDGSRGNAETGWYNSAAGTQDDPYLIRNGDDLAGLSKLVNDGTDSFEGKYIQLIGLTEEEAEALRNSSNPQALAGVIDLRPYNGATSIQTGAITWTPIGKEEALAFQGTFFSAAASPVHIVNFNYSYDASSPYSGTVYGLFGYNSGTLRDFTLSFAEYPSSSSTGVTKTGVQLTANIATFGGAVGVNTGTVEQVSVGVGGQTYSNGKFGFDAEVPLTAQDVTFSGIQNLGGVVGQNVGGTVTGCYFTGALTGTQAAGTATDNGVGGVTGVSQGGALTRCVANAQISVSAVNKFNAYGVVAGKLSGGAVMNGCVALGSLSTLNLYTDTQTDTDSSFGGVAGRISGSTVTQCASGANVTVKYLMKENSNNKTYGVTGGVVGAMYDASQMEQCFSFGKVQSYTVAGGLAGYLGGTSKSSTISNSYSTASMDTGSHQNADSGNYQNVLSDFGAAGLHTIGGLVGFADEKGTGAQVTNSYFAGSTFKSEIGSVVGGIQNNTVTEYNRIFGENIYFDALLSPNRGVGASSTIQSDGSTDSASVRRKSTAELQALFATAPYQAGAGAYGQLSWAAASNTGDAGYDVLLQQLAVVSTASYLNLNTASYGNVYQIQSTSALSGAKAVPEQPERGVTAGKWEDITLFNGLQSGNNLGGIYQLPITGANSVAKYAFQVQIQKKLLLAVNTEATGAGNADFIPNAASFKRFLDLSNLASGAYLGGVFTVSQTITEPIEVKNAFALQGENTVFLLDNLFCATLTGANADGSTAISSVSLPDESGKGFVSLLGSALSGQVTNLTFSKVEVGTANDSGLMGLTNTGFLFAQSKGTEFRNLHFGMVNVLLDTVKDNSRFGLLTGTNILGVRYGAQSAIADITVENATVVTRRMGAAGNNGIRLGLFAGEVYGTAVSGCTVEQMSLTMAQNVTNNNNSASYAVGGLFGIVQNGGSTGIASLSDCHIRNLTVHSYGNRNSDYGHEGFGGIASVLKMTQNPLTNCTVTGSIVNKNETQKTSSELRAGGIVGFMNNGTKISNCRFTGEIADFGYVGGIASYTNGGTMIEQCAVVGNLSAKVGNANGAGGIVGNNSAGITLTNLSFMGNVSGISAGGLIGVSRSVTVQNGYANAIVTGTSASGYTGGLIGDASTNKVTLSSVYFTGQLQGEGFPGGLVGRTATYDLKNAYFDKSIAGKNTPTIFNISTEDPVKGAQLDAACARLTAAISAANLGSGFVDHDTATNYPNLSALDTAVDQLATQKVIGMSQDRAGEKGAYLTSNPYFQILESSDASFSLDDAAQTVVQYEAGKGYSPLSPGQTKATVEYTTNYQFPSLNGKLALSYDILYVPFEYGAGTQGDPYIIYNEQVLKDFGDYVNGGFDTPNTYYKIGSVKDGKVIGNPITLDLQDQTVFGASWDSIRNFSGHLEGNDSVLKNLVQTAPYIAPDAPDYQYYGFFATAAGDISKLTIDGVRFSNAGIATGTVYAGALVGKAGGGNYSSISVVNTQLQDKNLRMPNTYDFTSVNPASGSCIGGIIGALTVNANAASNVQNCTSLVDIAGKAVLNLGGLIGYAEMADTGVMNIDRSASYGSISGQNGLIGGLVGGLSTPQCPVNITNSISTMDLSMTNKTAALGGLVGGANPYNTNNVETKTTISSSYYGGKLSYPDGSYAVGGLLGRAQFYEADLTNTYDFKNVSPNEISTEVFATPEAFHQFLLEKQEGLFTNCAYNYNVNRVPECTAAVRYRTAKNQYTWSQLLPSYFEAFTASASSTQKMTTAAGGFAGADPAVWELSEGHYPIPQNLMIPAVGTNQAADYDYLAAMAQFYSIGIYYTNAGVFGDSSFSNIYLLGGTGSDAATEQLGSVSGSAGDVSCVTTTYNGKMVQSTGEAAKVVTVPIDGRYNGSAYQFRKAVSFRPSVVACGVSDGSFVYANPEGMWVTRDGNTAYPFTIYTADQLQGLTAVVNRMDDGNGITGSVDYNQIAVTDSSDTKGSTFVLDTEIDCSPYDSFAPICPAEIFAVGSAVGIPFDSSLNGRGHLITGLTISGEWASMGLFSNTKDAALSNLGIANPSVDTEQCILPGSSTLSVGSLVGTMENTSIDSCFSALTVLSLDGNPDGTIAAGGLAGTANGSGNLIRNSFYTGLLYLDAADGVSHATNAGGILGAVPGEAAVSNCYVAAYMQADGITAVIAPTGSASVSNCYYDLNATGDMEHTNGAVTAEVKAADLGSVFQQQSGFYPLQTVFGTANAKANSAVAKVYLGNARSATSGSVTASGYAMTRLEAYRGLASVGTVEMADDFRSFSKNDSGFLFLTVGSGNNRRLIGAELKCWYNNPSAEGVYTINTAKELLEFAKIVNGTLEAANNPNGQHIHGVLDNTVYPNSFAGKTVRLGSDIDLADLVDYNWEAAGIPGNLFAGIFDGNGHTVTVHTDVPLFGTVSGTIQNLGLNGSVDASASTGTVSPLASQVVSGGRITGCFTGVEITGASNAAGLVGTVESGAVLDSCFNMGAISGNGTLAGLVWHNAGTIKDCYNTGIIDSKSEIGEASGRASGIAASNSGVIEHCFHAANLTSASSYAIAPDGQVLGCAYDRSLTSAPKDTAVADTVSSNFGSGSGAWTVGDEYHYPRLAVFTDASSWDLFQSVSDLSSLILRFNGENYQSFASAELYATAGDKHAVAVDGGGKYRALVSGQSFQIRPMTSATGAGFITGSYGGFNHKYAVVAQATMKIRYKFDFSGLFQASDIKTNALYHGSDTSSVNTWQANAEAAATQTISTKADFLSFIAYVNGGGDTQGKRFVLDYNIDFGGDTIPMITGVFNGTFDGGYYMLSDFSVTEQGTGALFAAIGSSGRVENLALDQVNVKVTHINGEMAGAMIAAENNGFLGNIAVTDSRLDVESKVTDVADAKIGFFAASNMGRITGCYAVRSAQDNVLAIMHESKSDLYNGSMVGLNAGELSGCYFVGNIRNPICLIAGTNTGEINNCYYASPNGAAPSAIQSAFYGPDGTGTAIESYWLTTAQLKSEEAATWLSSNIYAGSYELGTASAFIGREDTAGEQALNNGYPYLSGYQLVKYDLSAYFEGSSTMLLSVWNTSEDEAELSISNGIFALDNIQFKYFSDIIMKEKLQFNMHELPSGINYLISTVRVYGANAAIKENMDGVNQIDWADKTVTGEDGTTAVKRDGKDFINTSGSTGNQSYTVQAGGWSEVDQANLVVVTIQFSGGVRQTPWGNFRTWSSTSDLEKAPS